MRRRLAFSVAMNSWGRDKVVVVGWAVSKMVSVLGDRIRVLVPAEGFVDGFLPWEGEVAYVDDDVGGSPVFVPVLAKKVALEF